jgi:hypothetical protein
MHATIQSWTIHEDGTFEEAKHEQPGKDTTQGIQ